MAKSTSQFRVAFRKARKKSQIPQVGTWQQWWKLLHWMDDDTILRLGQPPKMWRSYKKVYQIEVFSAALFDLIPEAKSTLSSLTESQYQAVEGVFREILEDNTKLLNYLPEVQEDETFLRGISTFHEVVTRVVRDLLREDPFLPDVFKLPSAWDKLSDRELLCYIEEFVYPIFEDNEPTGFRLLRRNYIKDHHSLFLCVEKDGQKYMTCVSREVAEKHNIPHQIIKEEFQDMDEDLLWREIAAQAPYIPAESRVWTLPEVEITENSIPLTNWEVIPKSNKRLIAGHLTGSLNSMVQIPLDRVPDRLWNTIPAEIQSCLKDESRTKEERLELLTSIRELMLLRRENPTLGDTPEIDPREEGFVFPFTWVGVQRIIEDTLKERSAEIEQLSPYLEKQIDILLSVKTDGAGSEFLDMTLELFRVFKQIDDGDIEDFYTSRKGFNFSSPIRSICQQLKSLTEQCRDAETLLTVIAAVREIREVSQEQEVETFSLALLLFDLLYISVSFTFGPQEYICGVKDGELLTRSVLPLTTPFYLRLIHSGKIVPFLLHLDEYEDAFYQVFEEGLVLSNFADQGWEKLPDSYMIYASELLPSKPDLSKPIESCVDVEGCSIERIIFIDGSDENTIYLRVDANGESSFYRLQRGVDWHLTNLFDQTQVNNEWVFVLACCYLHDMEHHPNIPFDRRRLPEKPFDMVERSNAAQEGAFDSSLDLFFDLRTD